MELATEYRIRRADDGIVRTIARRGEFERNPSGRPIRMLGAVQDVTEQRLARAAVAESEARFRAFAEAVPNQVWSAAPDGRLDWANQRTFDFDGQDLERLMANGWEQQVHPDDLHQAVDAWARAIDTGEPYVTEFRLCRADGEYRWHIARAIALFDDEGRVERWIGTNTDIHDERSTREALAELNVELERRVEERTRERDSAWSNSQDLQAVLDTTGIFRAVNDAWETVLGWTKDEVVGRVYSDFVHPDDLPRRRRRARDGEGGAPSAAGESLHAPRRHAALDIVGDRARRRRDLCQRPACHEGEGGRDRARGSPGAAPPGAEDGSGRTAHRGRRSRLQ